jgi:hypothetical protein
MNINSLFEDFASSQALDNAHLKIPTPVSLDISRKDMPQIPSAKIKDFLAWLTKKGIGYIERWKPAAKLKPTQSQFNAEKVQELMARFAKQPNRKPIIISQDDYLLDSHHSWLAAYNKSEFSYVNTIEVQLPIQDLIVVAKKYSGVHYKGINEQFEILLEGLYDKGAFKAVFMGGGPGAGKDWIRDRVTAGLGFTELNPDPGFTFLMKKSGLDHTMRNPDEHEAREVVRKRAKLIAQAKAELALKNRNGVVVNGTAADVEDIEVIKKALEDAGYETMMIFVNTSDEVSKQRNIERGQAGDRQVPEHIRSEKWRKAQANLSAYKKMFGPSAFIEIDNSTTRSREDANAHFLDEFKKVKKFVETPVQTKAAQDWKEQHAKERGITKLPKQKSPHREKPDLPGAHPVEPPADIDFTKLSGYQLGQYVRHGNIKALKEKRRREVVHAAQHKLLAAETIPLDYIRARASKGYVNSDEIMDLQEGGLKGFRGPDPVWDKHLRPLVYLVKCKTDEAKNELLSRLGPLKGYYNFNRSAGKGVYKLTPEQYEKVKDIQGLRKIDNSLDPNLAWKELFD